MSKHENEGLNRRQNATTESSSAMRLDPLTERELYALYRDYFRDGEDRRDPLWRGLSPVSGDSPPSTALAEAVLSGYREDLFLPDYLSSSLRLSRASRGRAWFWTRWSYEESRHLLGVHEWLIGAGVTDDATLRDMSLNLLGAERWEPPFDDAVAIFVDALLWEMHEIERSEALKIQADSEGQATLSALLGRTLLDEKAHRDFFAQSLRIIARLHPGLVKGALSRIAASWESESLESELTGYLAPL